MHMLKILMKGVIKDRLKRRKYMSNCVRTGLASLIIGCGIFTGQITEAHCEIPCGIYGDKMRVDLLKEHFQTVEKSMNQIDKLKKNPTENANQLVRWVSNKELHANKIQEIVYQYFMNQRVKPVKESESKEYKKYVAQITALHRMLVQSMKCKQTTDTNHVKKLRKLLDRFDNLYFEDKEHNHKH